VQATGTRTLASRPARERWSLFRAPAWLSSWLHRLKSNSRIRGDAESVMPELAAIACFLILLWASIAIALKHEYETAKTGAIQNTANLARAFEESTRRTIGQIDQILLSARAFYSAQGNRFNFDDWARTQTVPDQMTAAIGMADASGHVFADTLPIPPGVNIGDRPHFLAQLDPAHDDLYISKPVLGRVSGQATIQFTRKVLGPHGEFAGATVLSLGCNELSRFYQKLDLGNGFVALLAPDGTQLARGPLIPDQIGKPMMEATVYGQVLSQHDGVIEFHNKHLDVGEIASFRRLQEYPLIVMVGLDTNTVFRQFWSLRTRMIISGAAVTVAICLIGLLWLQQKRRSIASRRALTITLETISQGILMVDARGNVPVVNPRARDLLAVPERPPEEMQRVAAERAKELAARHPPFALGDAPVADAQFDVAREDGTVIEVRNHALPDGGFVHSYTDVTEQRLADARIRYLAHHDTLTGLANRVQLRQRMPEFCPHDADGQQSTAFVLIDLDGFKGINDTLGHDVGDELLVEIARRLQTLVREVDFVARLGGDEFVILQPGVRGTVETEVLAEKLLQYLAEPVQVGGQQVRVSASIGITMYPSDGHDGDALFKHADIALYCAKAAGRGTYRFFDPQMTRAVNEHRLLESGLRWALDNQALELHFQPKFDCNSLAIVGLEALVRWRHPTRGNISPQTFIRIAEECGLIKRLGLWVIEEACRSATAWKLRRPVAVNVSLLQLYDGDLPGGIAEILRRTGLPADMLEIEVTESVMADDNQVVMESLHALKAMGIRIALDDFGTGYSSLSYLRRFSFDKIKIDKSFVQGQAHDQGVRVILEAILGMCHKLGLPVIGEGVETRQQLAMLRQYGCTEVQGYLLGRPIPANAVEKFVEGNIRDLGKESGLVAAAEEFALAS
jgi:diguanylate cyclase (GGDEF)-like protein